MLLTKAMSTDAQEVAARDETGQYAVGSSRDRYPANIFGGHPLGKLTHEFVGVADQ